MKKVYRIGIPIWVCAIIYIEHIGSISLGDFGIIMSIMTVAHILTEK